MPVIMARRCDVVLLAGLSGFSTTANKRIPSRGDAL
jgi:hypothetical protein